MLEIFQHFEEAAVRFASVVLIVPGLAAVLVGLFVWLGGLGFRGALAVVAGAVSGGICGFFLIGRSIIAAAVPAGAAVFIAIMFERKFIVLLTAVLAAALGFAILARPYIENADSLKHYPEHEMQNMTVTLGVRQSIETVKAYAADFDTAIKQACLQMPAHSWVIIGALVVIFIAAGSFFWRLTSALCCATLGAILIFAGMILLLLYKGAAPISSISRKQSFYAAVFIAMIVVGMIEQLLLCPRLESKVIRRKEAKKDKDGAACGKQSWRTN